MSQSKIQYRRTPGTAQPACSAWPDCPVCGGRMTKRTITRSGERMIQKSCKRCEHGFIKPP